MTVPQTPRKSRASKAKLMKKFAPTPQTLLLKQASKVFQGEDDIPDPIGIARRLLEDAKSGGLDTDRLVETISEFKKDNTKKLMRRSRKSYYQALARAYSLYLALTARRLVAEQVLVLVPEKLRKNANIFQEILRLAIDYTDEKGSRAAAGALARDAGALEWAFRNNVGPKDLLDQFERGEAGLESMYAEIKKLRRAKKLATKQPAKASDASEVRAVTATSSSVASKQASKAEHPAILDRPQLAWSDGLDVSTLLNATVRANDAILLASIDPSNQCVTIKRAYLTEYGSLDRSRRLELFKLLRDAAVVKRRIRSPRRSKV